ncbi:MAG TPA: hypothetical protein VNF72_04135, partial [Myxococcota bacterium]|nr:hypothetical protein [Myxococcota bacterium]
MSVAAARRPRAALGWVALLLLIGFSAAVHHGVGPLRPGTAPPWYAPRAFLFASDATVALLDPPALA